ncbi:MAG: hypothetical protein B5766_00935 [Candidatus Lumbricidophila eiseniae]|uniref:HpcH/HpaI aldolase/citrate lyase domain-containing protein n=1 Tax=Candidatus Lumbricidiphila eiseniae TaxID=1969409 RepID=A0A2A6FUU9_9MICO|nr:MAG: hypothetical protein B5766_00935 [Candidatus Lumbricidophila eiseniae]
MSNGCPSVAPVTGLYVPGDRPDRFERAAQSGADLIIFDLEDSVAATRKNAALDNVMAWLTQRAAWLSENRDAPDVEVRVNANADHEVETLAAVPASFGLRVPKVHDPSALDRIAELCGGRAVTALIESAVGIEHAARTAAHPSVARLALGESDLASELGSREPEVMDYVRARVLVAALACGLPAPMLSVYPDTHNLDGLRADTERGKRGGWWGRVAIHPVQIPLIRSVFAPSEQEREWARSVVSAVADGGVTTLDNGEMVDSAMLGRAHRILEL